LTLVVKNIIITKRIAPTPEFLFFFIVDFISHLYQTSIEKL
jgi:hypothetical protein